MNTKRNDERIWEPLMLRKKSLSHLIIENDRIAVSRYIEQEGRKLYHAADMIKFKKMLDEEFIASARI